MKILPLIRRADGTASPEHAFPTTWARVLPEHLEQIYGGQQVQPAAVRASPPAGYSTWQARDGRLMAFSTSDAA